MDLDIINENIEVLFAKRVKELRLENNLTQIQLSSILKVHQTTLKDWETRNKEPSFEMVIRLAKIFGVTTDYLLGAVKNRKISFFD